MSAGGGNTIDPAIGCYNHKLIICEMIGTITYHLSRTADTVFFSTGSSILQIHLNKDGQPDKYRYDPLCIECRNAIGRRPRKKKFLVKGDKHL